MYAIVNAEIFDGYNFLKNKAVIIDENKIKDIIDASCLDKDINTLNAAGNFLSAGFIDLQINGCGGALFNDDISEKTLEIMFKTVLKFGCTSFVPTLITAEEKDIKLAIDAAISFYKKNPNAILGIHIEGPYISKKKSGTHNPSLIKRIDLDFVDYLCKKVKDIPITLTIAPEENDISFIRKLALGGVKLSIGHSNASYDEAMESFANGVTNATHLFNTMTQFESRSPGIVGAIFNSDIYAGIIVDGIHSDFNCVRIAKKNKGDKLYIVTDAATSMGSQLKEFDFGGFKVFVKDGICRNEAGALAGSNIDMASSVKNAVLNAGIPLDEAIRMATLYPAKSMGVNMQIGSVKKDMTANLAIFDRNFKVKTSIFNGNILSLV
ncbi:MAG: N-acetylglucosamine-6-phosphate deacetylase [Elusimicrobiota bacterium]|nr:N-acetylglucosamine-6-phosphate deacetylase [Elusimicrobiota bacterium]